MAFLCRIKVFELLSERLRLILKRLRLNRFKVPLRSFVKSCRSILQEEIRCGDIDDGVGTTEKQIQGVGPSMVLSSFYHHSPSNLNAFDQDFEHGTNVCLPWIEGRVCSNVLYCSVNHNMPSPLSPCSRVAQAPFHLTIEITDVETSYVWFPIVQWDSEAADLGFFNFEVYPGLYRISLAAHSSWNQVPWVVSHQERGWCPWSET